MNGVISKRIRSQHPGDKSAQRAAKRAYHAKRTAQAQCPKATKASGKKTLLTGKKPQPMGSSAWKRTGPLIVIGPRKHTEAADRLMPVDLHFYRVFGKRPHRLCATDLQRAYGMVPKHLLDAEAQRVSHEHKQVQA